MQKKHLVSMTMISVVESQHDPVAPVEDVDEFAIAFFERVGFVNVRPKNCVENRHTLLESLLCRSVLTA